MSVTNFIDAVTKCLDSRNYYGALTIALILPDVCGKLQSPNETSSVRYCGWARRYLEPRYTPPLLRGKCFLTAEDTYALRCSLLHEGKTDISEQRIANALRSFVFHEPPKAGMLHCNQVNQTLLLDVAIFSGDICQGAIQWLRDVAGDVQVQERMKTLIEIRPLFEGGINIRPGDF